MRLFQNSGLYPSYVPRLRHLTRLARSFSEHIEIFLDDRFGAPHFLNPVLQRQPEAFFTNGDDEPVQRLWASERGMAGRPTLESILLSQIEEHRTEIFYNMDPMRYASHFVRKLPGCVRTAVAWRAAPSPGADFGAYGRVICNFPSILESYRVAGWKAAYFAPAHDPVMDEYAANTQRPIDVIFVGGYSRHHFQRAQVLEAVARQRESAKIVFHLDRSRLTKIAESLPGRLLPLVKHRRPADIRAVTVAPLFGRSLYHAISRAKIVLNGAVDMAGIDRGNMRCFESMGCGALLLSDDGRYPEGMVNDRTLLTYRGADAAVRQIETSLRSQLLSDRIARAGHTLVRDHYSKEDQWAKFQALLGSV